MRWALRTAFGAVLLIGIGVFLLLRDNGTIDRDVRVWPVVLIAIGLWLLIERFGRHWGWGGWLVPLALLAVGIVYVLRDTGAISRDVQWGPILLIVVGAAILLSAVGRMTRRRPDRRDFAVPLEGATAASVTIEHGAGRLHVREGAAPGQLLQGTFTGGLEPSVQRSATGLDVRLRQRWAGWSHDGRRGLDWDVLLSGEVPLTLRIKGGANQAVIDLSGTRATDVSLESGASSTELVVPAEWRSSIRVRGGAAKVVIRVPAGVGAAIRTWGGMASFRVDPRFPALGDGRYRSLDFDTAEAAADIDIDVGAASVEII